jgi:hypothetical protein
MILDILEQLSKTSLPGVFALAGVFFIFLSLGGKIGAQLVTDNIPKRYAAITGVFLILCSLVLFVVPMILKGKDTILEPKPNTYNLHPIIPLNQPISQLTDMEWSFASTDKSIDCSSKIHKEYIITILGRDSNGEASVAKRNAVSDISTVSCNISGINDPVVTTIHGELEGKELLAHQTQEGQWSFDELLGATEKQKKAIRNEGFIEPFTGYPHEKVPIGTVITFKDQDVSLIIGATIPGKKEGNVAIKFDHIVKDREPIAILSYSMDISLTTLDENNKEIIMKMALNGGGHMPLSENTKINSVTALSGVVTYIMPSSNIGTVSGPATMKITIKEL